MTAGRLLLSILAALAPAAAWGWGDDGHRIIGHIAWHSLSPAAREELSPLMTDPEYGTLAELCTWADRHARRFEVYDWVKPFHYVNVDPSADGYVASRDCPAGDCVVAAITRYSRELADAEQTEDQRILALRLLTHLVGDVHQPLHVAHPDDKGGNLTFPLFFGELKNLHWVWDSGLLGKHLDRICKARDQSCWRRLAEELRAAVTTSERAAWTADRDPSAWADESLAISRELAFDIDPREPLGSDYLAQTSPVVRKRLQMAGVRLAALLERILALAPTGHGP